jgi:hypothetical protein
MKSDKSPPRVTIINLVGIQEKIDQQNWIIKYIIYGFLNLVFFGMITISLIFFWDMHPLIFAIINIFMISSYIGMGKELIRSLQTRPLRESVPTILISLDFILAFLLFGIWLFYLN